MPLSGEKKREYQRKYMAKKRGQVAAPEVVPDPKFKPYRDQWGDLVIRDGVRAGNEHYWLRRLGEEAATCTEFEYQGRLIGGCGAMKRYEGKLLDGGIEEIARAIIDSPNFKAIQQALPMTKGRG